MLPEQPINLSTYQQGSVSLSYSSLSGAVREVGKSSSGKGGKGLESRIAKLESDVENIKGSLKEIKEDVREIKRDARSDFRLLFGAIITTALGLATLMAKGFHWF